MDDLAAKLGELLNNPGSLEKLKSLAGLLGGAVQEQPPPAPEEPAQGGSPGIDTEVLQMVTRIMPLLSNFRQEDDNTRLLRALRPLLSPARQKKLDESIKILQLVRLLPLLRSSGIL
ncbi:hypothetical protein FL966_08780 [Caproiciproducens galactitolivorans]|uniref:Uncharacterized protein n=1 Tax=Caproiciproducens galactitolivorans TaxID=642589 RepID=A0A4Z0Y9L3_9FIRM|nr:hypothetical protein [Caproiciproducens galactitolivorans]QEY35125.1 hypothetical protein FL966_08780 [Caproiciproducens galactitolivorans]TGJ76648.1 hypothetical protein CAGA_11900 [Caproiciproducens galactitolivorans]